MSGSPNLTASIAGSNEFTPGTSTTMNLLIQNTGLNTIKMVQSGIVDRDDLPSTAKMVTVSLASGDAPVLIRSDPQMIGDIPGSARSTAEFEIRIPDDAQSGTYTLPVLIEYTYLENAEQMGTDSITYRYVQKKLPLDLPFIVKSAINLEVEDVVAAGAEAGAAVGGGAAHLAGLPLDADLGGLLGADLGDQRFHVHLGAALVELVDHLAQVVVDGLGRGDDQ